MKKLFGTIILTMSVLAFSPSSHAQDFRPYAGIGVGAYFVDLGTAINNDQTVFGGFGQFGVDIGEYFGGELRLGTSSTTSFVSGGANVDLTLDHVFSYLAKVQVPVSEELRFYALAGGTTGQATGTITSAGFVWAATGTTKLVIKKTSFSFGGGLDFRIQDQWSIGAEYMRYYSDVSGFTANLKYLF